MKGRVRVPLYVIAAGLLGLIGLLATLQYRWLGRISEAERDRMRATLETGASEFAQDFDAELTRGYLLFQTDPLSDATDGPARFADRYDRWHATAKFPRMIAAFYVFRPDDQSQLMKFDPATRDFAAVAWPAAMSDWRAHLTDVDATKANPSRGGDTFFIRHIASPIWESAPAIVVPSPLLLAPDRRTDVPLRVAPRLTYTILQLDRDYITTEVLPALVQQHFTRISGSEFQVAVVSREPGGALLYHSSTGFNPAPGAHVDASADLFSVRTQDFSRLASEVHRFTAYAATVRMRTTTTGLTTSPDGKRPVSIIIERSGTPGPPSAEEAASAGGPPPLTRVAATRPSWQLLLAHQSGSLEAAVSTVRRRNLLVSFSVLGVLAASVGLLVQSTRRAQRLAHQQMEFVATVSHELRTPLAVIRSAADNLADGIVDDRAQVRKYGELVRGEGRRLTEMVEQILEFSGIQSGERRLQPVAVPLGPVLRGVIETSRSLVQEAGIEIAIDVPDDLPPVLGDEAALGRVFQNLLGNAIKYGASGRWIGLNARRHGHEVVVTVADRGIGIDPADHARIFEPFYRAAAVVDAQIQGAGLGLSLVERIVHAHGGEVSVRSATGEGATFTVRLPIATSDPAGHTSRLPSKALRYS